MSLGRCMAGSLFQPYGHGDGDSGLPGDGGYEVSAEGCWRATARGCLGEFEALPKEAGSLVVRASQHRCCSP
jgi:hypothetical protein